MGSISRVHRMIQIDANASDRAAVAVHNIPLQQVAPAMARVAVHDPNAVTPVAGHPVAVRRPCSAHGRVVAMIDVDAIESITQRQVTGKCRMYAYLVAQDVVACGPRTDNDAVTLVGNDDIRVRRRTAADGVAVRGNANAITGIAIGSRLKRGADRKLGGADGIADDLDAFGGGASDVDAGLGVGQEVRIVAGTAALVIGNDVQRSDHQRQSARIWFGWIGLR